ncbi:DUF2851 family protein [Candidatus Protochlamydia phocaeensis]|uniref:DUF2851 family protein n=1 Tax=Candidatus Protochlamydia phocaeensis TaxID=1414722 RepID=UPI0008393F5B|nr:DUF2851 family protein [Candidatus Protochlamydia phocaeensis]
MFSLYPHLLDPFPCASEKKQAYALLTERHLQAVWLEQKYVRGWTTKEGERIEVLSPGIWNTEAGPDFLKAHIRIGKQEYRGDIEIHLSDEEWYAHGHHQDPRYNQVMLHLSYHLPSRALSIRKENGQAAVQVYVEKSLSVPLSRLMRLVDLDLYPYRRFVSSGKCEKELFQRLSESQIKDLLMSAAYWRLERKADYLQNRLADRSLQLAGGMAMALGYRHNAEAFLELFLFLLPYRDLPYSDLLAIALGCCGFFEEGRKWSWEQSIYYQQLRTAWGAWKDQIIHQASLRLDRIRPLNHPIRRLAYLVKLLQDRKLDSLWFDLLAVWQAQAIDVQSPKEVVKLVQRLIDLIPNYEDPYWKRHFTFEACVQREELPLVGEDLKREMLINTYLPLLYATIKEKGDYEEWRAFQRLYQTLKSPLSSKKRYLMHRFFGESSKKNLLKYSEMAQGAYQLHKDFCLHFEASCDGCPFVERYLSREMS